MIEVGYTFVYKSANPKVSLACNNEVGLSTCLTAVFIDCHEQEKLLFGENCHFGII